MTTLATDTYRALELGDVNEFGVIASDIIYEGAAVGLQASSGYARPLVAGDVFVGFCEQQVDNSAGTANAKNVRCIKKGAVQLTVSGVLITDVGQPVYATDDNAFQMSPVGGSFIGFVRRWVSSGVAIVGFDAENYTDPYEKFTVREAISANKTLDAEDSGKLFWVDTDAVTITLPAVAVGTLCTIVNGGGYGTVAVTVSPAAVDSIEAPNKTAADDTDIVNTKATAKRGDLIELGDANADGYIVTRMIGTWA